MTKLRPRFFVLGAAVAIAACAGRPVEQAVSAPGASRPAPVPPAPAPAPAPAEETAQDRIGRRRDAILGAPACTPPAPVDTTGWEPATINGRALPLRLPREFRPDTAPDTYHGGAQWRAGTRTFFMHAGWWGVHSPNACRATFRSGDYIVQRWDEGGKLALTAFPADTVWRPSTLLGGEATTQAELAVLWTILRSLPPWP